MITANELLAFVQKNQNNPDTVAEITKPIADKIAELTTALVNEKQKLSALHTVLGVKRSRSTGHTNGKTIGMAYDAETNSATFERIEKPGMTFTADLNKPDWQKSLATELKSHGINGDTGGTVRGIIQKIRVLAGLVA